MLYPSDLIFKWIIIHFNFFSFKLNIMSYFFNGSSFIIMEKRNTILHINICYKTICSSFNMNTFYSYKTMLCSNNSQSQFSLVLSATIKQSKPNMTWYTIYPLRSRHPLILSWFWMYNVIFCYVEIYIHSKQFQATYEENTNIYVLFADQPLPLPSKCANFIKRTTFWTF